MQRLTKRNERGIACSAQPFMVSTFDMVDKLAAYEDAEEQGLLVHLPCKVGDTIYVIINGKIYDGEVYHISFSNYYGTITTHVFTKSGVGAPIDHFGTFAFLTHEEAEAKLREVERE